MFELEKINKKGYGYELDNPIRVNQIPGTHEYITSLKHKNGILVNYKRAFAEYCEETKHMVDIYYIYHCNRRSSKIIEIHNVFRYVLFSQ